MKFKITYNPEIHKEMCAYLDKEVKQDMTYQKEGISSRVGLLKERKVNVAGKSYDITAGVRDRFNALTPHSCYYEVIKEGEILFTFGSLIDKLPRITTTVQRLQMLVHTRKDLKSRFGNNILKVKEG